MGHFPIHILNCLMFINILRTKSSTICIKHSEKNISAFFRNLRLITRKNIYSIGLIRDATPSGFA